MFMILAGSKEEHLDMLDGGIIQRLLEEKWKTFAQRQFIKRISIAAAHILVISMAVYLRPGNPSRNIGQYEEAKDVVRLCFEMCSIFGSVYYVIFQQGEEIKNQGLVSFVKQLVRVVTTLNSLPLQISHNVTMNLIIPFAADVSPKIGFPICKFPTSILHSTQNERR